MRIAMRAAAAAAMLAALSAGAIESEQLLLGLIMDDHENPADISENPATVMVEGVLNSTAGKFGEAIEFDGNNANRIQIEHAEKLGGMEAFTITAWLKCEGVGDLEGMSIISKRQAHTVGDAYNIFLWAGGKVHARVNGKGQLISQTTIENGVWYHLAYLFDADGGDSAVRLLLDGVEEASGIHGDAAANADESPVWIGELDANRGFAWKGALDEVAVWSGALSDEEIAETMEEGINLLLSVDPQGRLAAAWGRLKARSNR